VVLLGVLLPVLGLMTMFAVDVAHWFDYSRNLQARADAAALAAGMQYGNTCATGAPDATAMAKIGQAAQLYSGPEAPSDVPYPFATPPMTFAPTGYQNQPTLRAGTLDRYHVFINADGPWQTGQSSNNNWPGHSGTPQSFSHGTVCAASYPDDQGGKVGPITDIWVTQDHLPLFFQLLNLSPKITAHSRVELQQGSGGNDIRPIAVRDAGKVACATVNFLTDDSFHTLLGSATLSLDSTGDPTHLGDDLWDNKGAPFTLPARTTNVIVQPVLGCGADAQNYDDPNTGVLYINSFGNTAPTAGNPPAITAGGVFLTGTCTSDQYFSTQNCSASVTANVTFAPGLSPNSKLNVTVTDTSTGTTKNMTNGGSGSVYTSNAFTIGQETGQHPFKIDWEQQTGSITGLGSCTSNPTNPCKGSFGVQAQAFGACNACDPPDDSGPMVAARLRLAGDLAGTSGRNAFANTATPNLVVELVIKGLQFDVPNPSTPAQILRVGTSTDKATGLINCGQGSGASFDASAIIYGCPLVNTAACKDTDFCAPLKAYDATLHPLGKCDPLLRQTTDPAYTDCVETTSGTRKTPIPGAIADRILQSGTCPANNWPAYALDPKGHPIPAGDPRAMLFIITEPADLTKNSIVPIKTFATFYITGWDTTGSLPNCTPAGTNEAWPGTGKSKQIGAIWGHWITYTDPTVIGDGTFCDPTQFGVCASVLTR
jgi:Putative Flp pilus-assembly TadE/G-like